MQYQGMVERLPLVHVDKSVAGKTLLHFYLARIKVVSCKKYASQAHVKCVAEDNHELAEEFAQKALGTRPATSTSTKLTSQVLIRPMVWVWTR